MRTLKQKLDSPIVVIGLGITGFSCVNYLKAQGYDDIRVVDSRISPPKLEKLKEQFPEIPITLGNFNIDLLLQAKTIILSPGISLKEPKIKAAIDYGIPVIGDIELFARHVKAPVAAITGSNGKSTVTTLVAKMAEAAGLKVRVGGNLGTPALDLIDDQEPDLYVLELSSFQLETTHSLKLKAASILNVTLDHMDRYEDFAAYLKAKQSIYNHTETAVLNRDDPKSYADIKLPKNIISFGLDKPDMENFGLDDDVLTFGEKKLLSKKDLKIKGQHNIANALAALALGKALNLPWSPMLEALSSFQGLEHRCQWVRQLGDVDWYNDSKATNVGATYAAVIGLGKDISGKIVLIVGGIGKNADFSELSEVIKKYVRTLILIGKDATQIEETLKNSASIVHAKSMEEAVLKAHRCAQPHDAVLLAPACASFDMFDNFEHRGKVFTDLVNGLS